MYDAVVGGNVFHRDQCVINENTATIEIDRNLLALQRGNELTVGQGARGGFDSDHVIEQDVGEAAGGVF